MAWGRAIIALVVAGSLAGCASLGGLTGGAAPAAPALDLASDDIASMVVALDLPDTVLAGREAPLVRYGAGPDRLDLTLEYGDAENVMGVLPPPREGRSYAVFAFTEADRDRVRAARAAGALAFEIDPRICATSDARKERDMVGALGILPGGRVVTLVPQESIAAFELRTGAAVVACAAP